MTLKVYIFLYPEELSLLPVSEIMMISDRYVKFKFNCKHTFERFCSIIFNISIDQSDTYKNTLIEDIDLEELFTHITDYYCEQIFLQAKQQKIL